jgi:hypothetical protein
MGFESQASAVPGLATGGAAGNAVIAAHRPSCCTGRAGDAYLAANEGTLMWINANNASAAKCCCCRRAVRVTIIAPEPSDRRPR